MSDSAVAHHDPTGGFRNPWPNARQPVFTGMLRWAVTRTIKPRIDRTRRGAFPRAIPEFAAPRADASEVSLTWVGHATFLIQIAGMNVLTDPVWSERCSPIQWAGPRRYMPPGIRFKLLPPIDLVLLSHDHYDHLDSETVRQIVSDHSEARWIVPLGMAPLLIKQGLVAVQEFDWWEEREVHAGVVLGCVPAQHFSGRGFRRNRTLWCGWTVTGGKHRVYFVGDTGRHPAFGEIGDRFGPFDAVLIPIGAYDPRWFMAPVHLDPEEAIESFLELTAKSEPVCPMVPMHWGTFKLTDEPMSEPPQRAKAIWLRRGLDLDRLWIMGHGETRWLP